MLVQYRTWIPLVRGRSCRLSNLSMVNRRERERERESARRFLFWLVSAIADWNGRLSDYG